MMEAGVELALLSIEIEQFSFDYQKTKTRIGLSLNQLINCFNDLNLKDQLCIRHILFVYDCAYRR